MVRLVWRLMVAQAVSVAAIGLPFSRRHLPSILITLSFVAALCLVALAARSGTRAAWLILLVFETTYFCFGLAKFMSARYLGGTLFSLVIACTLLHPSVARAYSVPLGRTRRTERRDVSLGDAAGERLSERAAS
jgi:hypothetical protein